MAAYPSYAYPAQGSTPRRIDGYLPVRASNGTLKLRKTMTGEKYEWDLAHELSAANWTAYEQFYQDNKVANVDLTYPGMSQRTVRFLAAPLPQLQPGGWYKVLVRLGEV